MPEEFTIELTPTADTRVPSHTHTGQDTPKVPIKNIDGLIEVVGALPTASPNNVYGQLKLGVSGSGSTIYFYDYTNKSWVSFGQIPTSTETPGVYGDGSDGDIDINSGTFSSGPITSNVLTRDAYFNNLTLSGGNLNAGGYRIFVKGTLTRTGAYKIFRNGNNGSNAGNGGSGSSGNSDTGGAVGTGGTGGAALSSGTLYGSLAGVAANDGGGGAPNVTGTNPGVAGGDGTSGVACVLQEYSISSAGASGVVGVLGGTGGGVSGGSGGGIGNFGAGGSITNPSVMPRQIFFATTLIDPGTTLKFRTGGQTGQNGSGGGGGSGDHISVNEYGAGGGGCGGIGGNGGTGGTVILIYNSKTGTCTTSVAGGGYGDAGSGGLAGGTTTDSANYSGSGGGGGGNGGNGSGGGLVLVVSKSIVDNGTGNMFEAIGGSGGNGGSGGSGGTGKASSAATDGQDGTIGVTGATGTTYELTV